MATKKASKKLKKSTKLQPTKTLTVTRAQWSGSAGGGDSPMSASTGGGGGKAI
jgi:hypothetical protein